MALAWLINQEWRASPAVLLADPQNTICLDPIERVIVLGALSRVILPDPYVRIIDPMAIVRVIIPDPIEREAEPDGGEGGTC